MKPSNITSGLSRPEPWPAISHLRCLSQHQKPQTRLGIWTAISEATHVLCGPTRGHAHASPDVGSPPLCFQEPSAPEPGTGTFRRIKLDEGIVNGDVLHGSATAHQKAAAANDQKTKRTSSLCANELVFRIQRRSGASPLGRRPPGRRVESRGVASAGPSSASVAKKLSLALSTLLQDF